MYDLDEVLLEKLASQFSAEELENIIGEAVEELDDDAEVEKTASQYYELGQVMALGFQDQLEELEKEAGLAASASAAKRLVTTAPARIGKVFRKMKERATGAIEKLPGHRTVKGGFAASAEDKIQPGGSLWEKLKAGGSAAADLTARDKRQLRMAAKGVGIGGTGVALTGGAGYAAMKKRSYDEGVYDALECLGLLDEDGNFLG
jgi:hypothetical protein